MLRDSAVRVLLSLALLALLLGLVTCTSTDDVEGGQAYSYEVDQAAGLEFLRSPVVGIQEGDKGKIYLALDPWKRTYVIDRDCSPEAVALEAFARKAKAAGRPVYATVQIRSQEQQGEPGRMPLILRLADTPDPRARK